MKQQVKNYKKDDYRKICSFMKDGQGDLCGKLKFEQKTQLSEGASHVGVGEIKT